MYVFAGAYRYNIMYIPVDETEIIQVGQDLDSFIDPRVVSLISPGKWYVSRGICTTVRHAAIERVLSLSRNSVINHYSVDQRNSKHLRVSIAAKSVRLPAIVGHDAEVQRDYSNVTNCYKAYRLTNARLPYKSLEIIL